MGSAIRHLLLDRVNPGKEWFLYKHPSFPTYPPPPQIF